MKTNKAPKKIYIFENPILDFTKLSVKQSDADIEYIRADAFIEKACDYLMEYEFNDSPTIADRRKRVDEFIKYMKV